MRLEIKTLLIVGKSSEAVPRLVLGRGLRSQKVRITRHGQRDGAESIIFRRLLSRVLGFLLFAFVQHTQSVED